MSYFYVKLIAFTIIAIISAQYKDKKLEITKKLQTVVSIALIIATVLSFYQNVKLMTAKSSEKNIDEQIKECEKIAKNESWYSKVELYNTLSQCAISQIKQGLKIEAEETLQKAYNVLKQRENLYPIRIEKYIEECQIIAYNITQIKQYVEIENEEYIKESINQINIIIAEAKENIKDYKITRMSKEYYEEKMQKLEQIAGEI